eukprot:g13434.t1
MTAYEESADLIGVLHMYLLMGKAHLTRRSFREARDATEAACWFGEQLGFRRIEENARTILQEIQAREAELPEPQLRRARVPEMPNVPKLDVQALDVEVLRDVVQLFVKVLIGSDDPIDPDRDHLAKVLPGLSPPLPVTLIYDYPSITSITQLVTTSAEASRVSAKHWEVMAPSPSAPSASKAVLDFDPNEADPTAVEQTRHLLSQVLAVRGHEGLRKALHVTEPVAAALKHRVGCVTCRSRLEPLVTNLMSSSSSKSHDPDGMNRPLPLTSWLCADEQRGLEPAPPARQDMAALAAFLASFGGGQIWVLVEVKSGDPLEVPRGRTKKGGTSFSAALAEAATLAALQPDLLASYEKERFVAILQSGTSEAEWRQLGTVDLDGLCELFFWLTDRGLCNTCIDAVVRGTGAESHQLTVGNCPKTIGR